MKRSTIAVALTTLFTLSIAHAAPHGMYLTHQQRNFLRAFQPESEQTLAYYGGPVISNVKVVAVFWGSKVNSTTQSKIGDFLASTVNSTYMDWLKEYNTNITAVDGRAGTNQTIGRGSFVGAITIQPNNKKTRLDDKEIQAELDQQIAAKVLPEPDLNSLYMIYFPPGVSISIEGMSSCQSFCAYHEGFKSQSHGNIYYGVMPDLGGACSWGCGFGSSQFDNLTAVSSHELIEAVTDPFPTPGNNPAYPQAWNTTDGSEIGDLCTSSMTNLTTPGLTYLLQQEFDNQTHSCAPGPYQSP